MNEETEVRDREKRHGHVDEPSVVEAGAEPSSGAPGEPSPGPAEAVADPSGEAVDYRDRWLRSEAELQNFRRRAQRELEEVRRISEDQVLLDMISILDDLERALQSARDAGAPDSWVQGVQLVTNRIQDDLARRGVTPMNPVGEPFDPQFHEALLEVDAPPDTEEGHVVEVVRQGYRRNGRALRAARVVVARKAAVGEN